MQILSLQPMRVKPSPFLLDWCNRSTADFDSAGNGAEPLFSATVPLANSLGGIKASTAKPVISGHKDGTVAQ